MPWFKKKESKDSNPQNLAQTKTEESAEEQNQDDFSDDFKDIPDYVEGLQAFMDDHNIDSEEEAIAEISKELDEKIKPKLNLNGNKVPSKLSSKE